MMPFQFNVDIISELEIILPSYQLLVPSFIINELEGIKKAAKGKDKIAASIALKISTSPPLKIIKASLKEGETADDALLRISKVLCTNDIELRERARKKGISVIYLRQKRYMAIDGHIN
ncbi:PIN domain-containing protein [Methanobacterium alcaliphilum]|uniref:type II toxin-antitoxin system VapC family toxin n=1 Tax=Methanobacterium alcaliphilum TaxID=392018 RepID=UPI00200AF8C8|nr:PIN domain-containing protein [Methanobacterium alcaliphilum]MCK9151759.1 twitching motility protein PilT [Methanobacterium alcaliphilum]